MDTLTLDGWTPVLLTAIVVAIIIFFISRKISSRALLFTSIVLSFACVGIVIYSIEVIGGWADIGLGVFPFSGFLGTWIGEISGMIIKCKRAPN